MTAVGSQPSLVTTLEQELVRVALAHHASMPRSSVIESLDLKSPWAAWSLSTNPEGRLIFVTRNIVEINPIVDGQATQKLFLRAKETTGSLTSLPAGFDSN